MKPHLKLVFVFLFTVLLINTSCERLSNLEGDVDRLTEEIDSLQNVINHMDSTCCCSEIIKTLTLKPNASGGKDAMISSRYPDKNSGLTKDFIALAWTNGGTFDSYRSLIEFNISTIPKSSTIVSASLSLHNNNTSANNYGKHSYPEYEQNACWLQRVTESWDEFSVTWNTQPQTTTTNQIVLENSTSEHQDYLDINVTQLVQDMVNNPNTSYGFMIKLQTEAIYRCLIFASSDNPNSDLFPKLVIQYSE